MESFTIFVIGAVAFCAVGTTAIMWAMGVFTDEVVARQKRENKRTEKLYRESVRHRKAMRNALNGR